MVRPGDTVYLRDGIYIESVDFNISGTEANPIRIMAFPGENPTIDGEFSAESGPLLAIMGDHIQLADIEVRNSHGLGIYVYGSHAVIDGLYVHHCNSSGF